MQIIVGVPRYQLPNGLTFRAKHVGLNPENRWRCEVLLADNIKSSFFSFRHEIANSEDFFCLDTCEDLDDLEEMEVADAEDKKKIKI